MDHFDCYLRDGGKNPYVRFDRKLLSTIARRRQNATWREKKKERPTDAARLEECGGERRGRTGIGGGRGWESTGISVPTTDRLAPVRGGRPLEWEKQIKTSAPVGFRRQETKINDIISCRTGRSLSWKRNRVKKSTTRQLISRDASLGDEIGPGSHYGIPGAIGSPWSDCRYKYAHTRTGGWRDVKRGNNLILFTWRVYFHPSAPLTSIRGAEFSLCICSVRDIGRERKRTNVYTVWTSGWVARTRKTDAWKLCVVATADRTGVEPGSRGGKDPAAYSRNTRQDVRHSSSYENALETLKEDYRLQKHMIYINRTTFLFQLCRCKHRGNLS